MNKIIKIAMTLLVISMISNIYAIDRNELCLLSPQVIDKTQDHTMNASLYGYLEMKIHELIKEREYKNIIVIGDADRSEGVSAHEKKGKMFNWQRPTAKVVGEDLYIRCYPGRDYVKHYASLIKTYLTIHHKKADHVRYNLPDGKTCWDALLSSNLRDVPKGDVVILGYGLDQLIGDSEIIWEGEGDFSWVTKKRGDLNVVFLGCRHSYWGDISGRIVRLLAERGFKRVIYIGKVGGMNAEGIPNETLATGDTSYVEGEIIHWDNLFNFARGDKEVVFGNQFTIPSVLNETKEWHTKNSDYAFVDNEIGFMARTALSYSMDFSYIHIISDNLNEKYGEDLSNERSAIIKEKRAHLMQKAKELIDEGLNKCKHM